MRFINVPLFLDLDTHVPPGQRDSIGYMEHSTAKQLKVSRKTAKRLRHVVKRIRLSLLNGQCCFCHPDALGAKQIDPWLWSDLHKLSKHNDASLFAVSSVNLVQAGESVPVLMVWVEQLIDCCDNDGNHEQLLDPFAEAILD